MAFERCLELCHRSWFLSAWAFLNGNIDLVAHFRHTFSTHIVVTLFAAGALRFSYHVAPSHSCPALERVVTFVALQIGFGAVLLTRAGRRREHYSTYDADEAWEDAVRRNAEDGLDGNAGTTTGEGSDDA